MDWTRGNPIGHGSSATVSVATNHCSGEVFAVKSMELSKSSILQREQKILSSITSPYVVNYMGCDVSNENGNSMYNLFMEYVAGGALSNQAGLLDEDSIRCHTKQILLGLDYLHTNGLVHCDIKGRNILISPNGAKIADLGCARRIDEEITIAGTPLFMAPEVARCEQQGFPADLWALGCTIIEMATGSLPWPEVKNNAAALYKIGFSDSVPEFPSFLSDDAKDFLTKCLRRNPKERWTTNQLLNHPFVSQISSCSKQIQVSVTTSPTSILDQDLWDSIQDSDASRGLNSLNSAMERVGKISSGVAPNWDLEENWITIRTNEVVEGCSDWLIDDEEATTSQEEMEIFECSVSDMDYYMDDDDVFTITSSRKSRNSSSSSLCSKNCFREVCKCVDSNLIFETQREFDYSFNTNFFRH